MYRDRGQYISRDEVEACEFYGKHYFGRVKADPGDYRPQQGKCFFYVSDLALSDKLIKYVYQILPDEVMQKGVETPFSLECVINNTNGALVHRWKVFCRDYDDEAAVQTANDLLEFVKTAYKVVGGLSKSGGTITPVQNDFKMKTKKSSSNEDGAYQGRTSTANLALAARARSIGRFNISN